jgi:hypothetical protein
VDAYIWDFDDHERCLEVTYLVLRLLWRANDLSSTSGGRFSVMVFTECTKKATLFGVLDDGRNEALRSGEAPGDSMTAELAFMQKQ